jgi:hypothetical protein
VWRSSQCSEPASIEALVRRFDNGSALAFPSNSGLPELGGRGGAEHVVAGYGKTNARPAGVRDAL